VFKIKKYLLSLDQAKDMGWAIYDIRNKELVDYDVKSFQKYKDYDEAIYHIKLFLLHLIRIYNPDVVTLEEVYYSRNKQVYNKLSKLQGVIINCLIEKDIEYEILMPSVWKNGIGIAKGKKTKREEEKRNSIKFVKDRYDLEVDDNTADAICMGYYYLTK